MAANDKGKICSALVVIHLPITLSFELSLWGAWTFNFSRKMKSCRDIGTFPYCIFQTYKFLLRILNRYPAKMLKFLDCGTKNFCFFTIWRKIKVFQKNEETSRPNILKVDRNMCGLLIARHTLILKTFFYLLLFSFFSFPLCFSLPPMQHKLSLSFCLPLTIGGSCCVR